MKFLLILTNQNIFLEAAAKFLEILLRTCLYQCVFIKMIILSLFFILYSKIYCFYHSLKICKVYWKVRKLITN